MSAWKVKYADLVERELTFDHHSHAYEAAVIAALNGGGVVRVVNPKGDEFVLQATKPPKK
jgi:hypothetical protein